MMTIHPSDDGDCSVNSSSSRGTNPLSCLGRVVSLSRSNSSNSLAAEKALNRSNSNSKFLAAGTTSEGTASTAASDSDEADDSQQPREQQQYSGESMYDLARLEEAEDNDLTQKRPQNHFQGFYSATAATSTDTDSLASTSHSKGSSSLHPSTETAAQRRAVVKRWNTDKYTKSRNMEDEALANQATDIQRTIKPTNFLDLIGQNVRGKRTIKSCLKKQEDETTTSSDQHVSSSTPRRPSEEGTSSSPSSSTTSSQPLSLTRRNRRAVRFATNTNNRVWCLTQTFPKVSASLRDTLWWDSEELYDLYEDAYQALDEEDEDEYGYAIQAAFASVDHTTPHCTHALFNFGTFVSCNTVRGLEKNVYDVADHIQRHMEAVLDTQRLMQEEIWCGGMEDDLRQEILALRSFKYSHPSRMVSHKLALLDHQILELYRNSDNAKNASNPQLPNDSSSGLLLAGMGEGSLAELIRDSSLYDEEEEDGVEQAIFADASSRTK